MATAACYLLCDTPDAPSAAGSDVVRRAAVADVRTPNRTNRDTYLEGIGVSGLNPKGLLVFVALLPQFTNPQSPWPLAAQMIVLGLTFILTCAGFYALLGSFARAALLTRPASARLVSRLSGSGMVTIGTVLVGDRLLN